VLDTLERDGQFGRGLWGALSLEIWQQTFHDRHRQWAPDRAVAAPAAADLLAA